MQNPRVLLVLLALPVLQVHRGRLVLPGQTKGPGLDESPNPNPRRNQIPNPNPSLDEVPVGNIGINRVVL